MALVRDVRHDSLRTSKTLYENIYWYLDMNWNLLSAMYSDECHFYPSCKRRAPCECIAWHGMLIRHFM